MYIRKLLLALAIIIVLVASQAMSVFAVESEPTLPPTVDKEASPSEINLAGSGLDPEETTVKITVSGAGGTSSTFTPIDVVFALDSSGSMSWNDPSGLRKIAAESFVDKLVDTRDKAGVVSWDDNIDFTYPAPPGVSGDFAGVKNAINAVDSVGGTDLNVGLYKSIEMLHDGQQVGSVRVIIFLTDGEGLYTSAGDSGPASVAATEGYVIYSIGLGSPAPAPLQDMANATGGAYYNSPDPSNLDAIFDAIFEEVVASTIPHYVDVVEVTQNYIVDEGSFNIAPNSVATDGTTGQTTITWLDIGVLAGVTANNNGDSALEEGEFVELTFNAKSSQFGVDLPVQVIPDARANYDDADENFVGYVEIPQDFITVIRPVALDIHPTSCPNPLNPKSRGLMPVAVLGTADFDVTLLDPVQSR